MTRSVSAPIERRPATSVSGGTLATPSLLNMKDEPHIATSARSSAQSCPERRGSRSRRAVTVRCSCNGIVLPVLVQYRSHARLLLERLELCEHGLRIHRARIGGQLQEFRAQLFACE